MKDIIIVQKPVGKTPLQMIDMWKSQHPEYAEIPMTYAGRLDPMAEGVLLLLTGEECKMKDQYLGLDKTYRAEFLLGVSTDTGDILGLVQDVQSAAVLPVYSWDLLVRTANSLKGQQTLPIPAYASVPVNGKPLFQWAREGRIDSVHIPTREMHIMSVSQISVSSIQSQDMLVDIKNRVARVAGDFRQEDILACWHKMLSKDMNYRRISLTLHVSSGTYIRSLAEEFGRRLNSPALLWSLNRTSVGEYTFPTKQKNHREL